MPSKPQSVLIERWLPYAQLKRRVVFQPCQEQCDPIVCKPKNVIVQWEAPKVNIKQEVKYLGVICILFSFYINKVYLSNKMYNLNTTTNLLGH